MDTETRTCTVSRGFGTSVAKRLCIGSVVALVALSSLSYLGIGFGHGTADWGRMLSDSRGES